MTNANLTHLAFVLDRSGSMGAASKATEAEHGIRALLADQAALPGDVRVTVAAFDDHYELRAMDADADGASAFLSIEPRGMTALYDAVGRTVTALGKHLASQDEAQRPGRVIFVIATDGMENASYEWNSRGLKDLITQQRDTYSWDFVFIGTSEDQMMLANDIGISVGSSIATADSGLGYAAAYAATSSAISRSRAYGQSVSYNDDERQSVEQQS